jgi:hypothetical protein
MTMPDDYQIVTDEDYTPDIKFGVPQELDAPYVRPGLTLAPEFVSLMTWQVPEYPAYATVLQRRVTRHRARLWVPSNGSTTPNGGASYTGQGDVVEPAAGTTVASLNGDTAIPAGTYTVSGVSMLQGTTTIADANNMGLYVGATLIQTLPYGDMPQTNYPWGPVTIVLATPQIVTVKTIGAGSGTATYFQSFQATPVAGSGAGAATAVVLGRTIAELQNGVAANGQAGSGLYIASAMIPFGGGGGMSWESQRECIATAIGGTVTLTVLDESYAQDRSMLQ